MKSADAPQKSFRLRLNRQGERYDGKTVEFLFEADGKLMLLTGQFLVHPTPDFERVDIHYAGHLDPHDPPFTYYVFHLSEAHLRSMAPARRPGSQADFLMERPLLARDCEKLEIWDYTPAEWVQSNADFQSD